MAKPAFSPANWTRLRLWPLSLGLPKDFAFCAALFQAVGMTQPLALVWYEKLMPGSKLVNRLQDLGYRVLTAPEEKQS